MKYCYIFLLFLSSCGTTGRIMFYDFPNNKNDVQKGILIIINKDSTYTLPSKLLKVTSGEFFESMYVYFKDGPEEFYQIGFTGDVTDWQNPSYSRLALISVFNGKKYQYDRHHSNKEKVRIQNRFESEILSKIKYGYTKMN